MDARLQPVLDLAKAIGRLAKAADGSARSFQICAERMHDTMHDFHMRQMMKNLASGR